MVPNSKTASQYGLSDASVLYECNVEGSMTRLMALWRAGAMWTRLVISEAAVIITYTRHLNGMLFIFTTADPST